MSGYIIVLIVFTFCLLPESYASLATFANRVSKCPDPNNVSEWEEASAKLACLHPLRGGTSMQLARVYHCLPSNFLNESVEYCGNSGAVAKGNCPVYKYGDGRNRAASYRSCANFTSGCPEEQYHSKDVYMYPACLNINPVDNCYVAEPMCEENYESVTDSIDSSSTESDKGDNDKDVTDHAEISSTEFYAVIGVIVTLFVIVIGLILWRKKTIPCPMLEKSNDGPGVHYNAENHNLHIGTDIQDNNTRPLLQDHENTEPKDTPYDPSQQNGNIVNQQVPSNAVSESEDDLEADTPVDDNDDILKLPFDVFLGKMGRKINRKTLIKLKDHLKAPGKDMTESEKQSIDRIATGSEAINLLHKKYDFYMNLYLLQSILEFVKEKQLAELCKKFGKKNSRLYYYTGHVEAKGYRKVILKLDKNINDYSREDQDRMRDRLLGLLDIHKRDDILIKGITEGCIAIHALVRQNVVDIIKSADISSLCKDCVVEVNVVGECIRSLGETRIPENIIFKEEDVNLSCFEVSFEFGPTALVTHKRVADKLQQHRKTMGSVDVRYDSVIIVHHTESDLCDIVLELFESEPIKLDEKKYTCVKNVDAVGNLVIFCCDRLSQGIVCQSLKDIVLEKYCPENYFIFCLEKCKEVLETKMDMDHILQRQGDKSHLYNAYCVRVEEEFKLFKKELEYTEAKNSTCFPAIVSSLEKLEEMLNSHNKKQQTNPEESIVAMNYLREMESYGIIGCMTDDGVLRMFGQITEDKDDAILEHLKLRRKMDNIEVVLNSITFYSLKAGGKLSGSNEIHKEYGSIGIFATLRKLGTPRLVCTGCAHVYIKNKNKTVYYEDGGEPKILGTWIWPNEDHLEYMGVVCLDEKVCCLVENELRKEIKIFDGELRDLINRKVYKYGAKSGYTEGYIEREFHMLRNRAVIVEGEGYGGFADSGDSGSIVLTKIGVDTFAIGVLVGSIEMREETEPALPTNPILVVSLRDSLHRFTKDYECEIEHLFLIK